MARRDTRCDAASYGVVSDGRISRHARGHEPIEWLKAVRLAFDGLPRGMPDDLRGTLSLVLAAGGSTIASPLTGLGAGVMELAPYHRGEAFRTVHAS
jgi:hypothetical protein